jgi:hypothetical protein
MPKSKGGVKGVPPVEHRFKPGQSGNPKGRIANPAMKALRSLTLESYREVVQLVVSGSIDELKDLAEQKESALKAGVARAFLKAISKGDYAVIEAIAQRVIGKIPEVVHIDTKTRESIDAQLMVETESQLKARIARLSSDV